jgi:hypothetical protein
MRATFINRGGAENAKEAQRVFKKDALQVASKNPHQGC